MSNNLDPTIVDGLLAEDGLRLSYKTKRLQLHATTGRGVENSAVGLTCVEDHGLRPSTSCWPQRYLILIN